MTKENTTRIDLLSPEDAPAIGCTVERWHRIHDDEEHVPVAYWAWSSVVGAREVAE